MKNIKLFFLLLITIIGLGSCEKKTYTLSSTVSPSLSGIVIPAQGSYEEGEVVTLVAQPNNGWIFQKWEGDVSGTTNSASLTMNSNKNVVAVFLRRDYPLNIMISGEGTVQEKIISSPSKSYPFETVVELTPVPKAEWMFDGWEGDLSGIVTPKNITIDKEKNVTAKFVKVIQVIGGSGTDYIYNAIKTKDGGFIATGTTASNDGIFIGIKENRSFDVCVIKFDKNGDRQWIKTFGGSGQDIATKIIQTQDGDFLITGEAGSNDGDFASLSKGAPDVFLLKINSNGEKIWARTYGGTGAEYAYSLSETHDGGCVIVGESSSNDGDLIGSNDIFIIKVSSNGEKMWVKMYGGSYQNAAYDITKTSDNGFLLTGIADTFKGNFNELAESDNYIMLIKINSLGEIQWISTSPGSNPRDIKFTGNQVIEATNGEILLVGSELIINEGTLVSNNQMVVLKYSSQGKLIWKKSLGGSKFDSFFDIVQASANEFILAGYSSSEDGDFIGLNKGKEDVYIVKYSSNGEKIWQKAYGGSNQDLVGSIVQGQDGKYFVVGYTQSKDGDFQGAPYSWGNIFVVTFR